MSPLIRPHLCLYRESPHLRAPGCSRLAEFVGVIHLREVGGKVALWSCAGCNALVVLHRHRVLYEITLPPGTLPVATEAGTP